MVSRSPAVLAALAVFFLACDDGITDADRVAIDFATTSDTIFKLASIQLTPTVTKGGVATDAPVTWSSSDTLVAKVNSSGLVTAVARGSALISARVESARAITTIVVDSLREVQVAPTSPAITAGDSIHLTATGVGMMRTVEVGDQLTWTSSDTSVAAVRDNGTVLARRDGAVTITASLGGVSGTAKVGVVSTTLNRQAVCAGTGTLHHGSQEEEIWRAVDNPHILLDTVRIARLSIEPGAVVCGLPNSALAIGYGRSGASVLNANGTAERPILFTAADTSKTWAGITTYVVGAIRHAVIESATRVIVPSGGFVLEDSRLRGADLVACAQGHFAATVFVYRNVFESSNVCLTKGRYEDNVVRRGSVTIWGDRGAPTLEINGGRIEDSPGVGLIAQHFTAAHLPTVSSTRPMRIVGAASYPIDVTLEIFREIWPTREAQDSLLGNAKDTLSLWGNGGDDVVVKPLSLRRDLPWDVYYRGDAPISGASISQLAIEPGASLTLRTRLTAHGSVTAPGTSANPIRIRDVTTNNLGGLMLTDTGSSVLSHVNFTGFMIGSEEANTVALDHLDSNGWIQLASPGSSISDSRVHDVGFNQFGAGPGAIHIRASNVQVLRSDVLNNRRDGIQISPEVAGSVEIHETNLVNNEFGVRNFALFRVDARRNWWGDPAGPDGPAGDGVSGNVDASEHLTAPRPTTN